MKNALLALALIAASCIGSAQDLSAKMDYKVNYAIPAPKSSTVDTVAISYDSKGKFIYTNSELLGMDFGRSVFKNPSLDLSSATASFVLDTEKMEIYFNFSLGENMMFFKMNLENLLPMENDDPMNDNFSLVAEKTGDSKMIAGKSYPTYLLYPDTNPEEPLTLAIDHSRPVNNNNVINEFIQMMLRKTESKGSMSLDIPDGLIVGVYNKENTMMEAVSIEDVKTNINISTRFNISE